MKGFFSLHYLTCRLYLDHARFILLFNFKNEKQIRYFFDLDSRNCYNFILEINNLYSQMFSW